ncbi:MAG: hypothetical protein C0442_09330 [Chlorobiaceae bacterium]|nr:hypothetical protein [Chlorobiaceae bacterium]
MENAIKFLNLIQDSGIFRKYSVTNSAAISFYLDVDSTNTLDVLFINSDDDIKSTLKKIYELAENKKYLQENNSIVVNNFTINFIEAENELLKEAVISSECMKVGRTKCQILKAEYLIALLLKSKDEKEKRILLRIIQEVEFDKDELKSILSYFKLKKKYSDIERIIINE